MANPFARWFGGASPVLEEQVQVEAPVSLANPVGSVARACIDRIASRACYVQFKSTHATPNNPGGPASSREFYSKLVERILIDGCALGYKDNEGFWRVAVTDGSTYDRIAQKWHLRLNWTGSYQQGWRTDYRVVPAEDVLFVTRRPLQGDQIYIPAAPIKEIYDAMVLYERARAHQIDYSDRGNKVAFSLQGKMEVQNKERFKNQRADLRRKLNEDKRSYGTYSTPLESELVALPGAPAPDGGSHQLSTSEIARHFGVPLQMLQTDAAPTTDEERVESRLLTDGVMPVVERIAAGWEKVLKTEVVPIPLSMGRPTLGARAAHLTALARTGCITINEGRELIGFGPIKGGDKFPEVVGGAERNGKNGRPGEGDGNKET